MNAIVIRKYARKVPAYSKSSLDKSEVPGVGRTMFGLTEIEFEALSKFIHGMQNMDRKNGDHFTPKVMIDTALWTYGSLGYSLVGMYNFLVWGQTTEEGQRNIETDLQIMATIGHDLNGKHDRLFAPRTKSYEYLGDTEAES